ncbi:MAG: YHS domain-containing protein [Pseudomonadales bacterium]|nr:YHS domain-containing protein [Pseudomonadales bacterium]
MKLIYKSLLLISTLATALFAHAGVETSTDGNDVILAGHDAVAYFTVGKPVRGSSEFTAQHDGAVYRFVSAKNRDLFRADPDKYAPAYGGYCALGTSFGKKFDIDGQAFEIVAGRLYVNKDLSVYKTWRKDIPNNIVKAEGQWPGIKDIPAKDL